MEKLEDFIFYGKIFTEDEICELLNKTSSVKLKRRTDYEHEQNTINAVGNRSISSEIILEKFNFDIILKKYASNLPKSYQNYFYELLKKKYYVDEKITKYDLNDSYGWHVDFTIESYGTRCLSTITYLNDDYSGGETEFFNKIIKPKKGNTLIFPSFWLFPHKGSSISSGIKLIYVCHFSFSPKKTCNYMTEFKIKYN